MSIHTRPARLSGSVYPVPSIIRPGVSHLIFLASRRQHPGMMWSFLCWMCSAFTTHLSMALENLALRQQLADH